MAYREPEYRRRRREKAAEDQRRADQERDKSAEKADQNKIISALQAIAIEQASAENTRAPKNKRETWLKLAEIIALSVAAAVGAVAIIVGNHDASRQLSTMLADQRPWLRPVVVGLDRFVLTDKELSFGISIQFLNTGKSLAFHVAQHFAFVAPDYPRLLIRQDDICKFAGFMSASTGANEHTLTIFPNEPSGVVFSFPFTTAGSVPPGQIHQFDVKSQNGDALWIAPFLIGCVAYQQYGDARIHHTWYAISIGKRGPDGGFAVMDLGPQVIDKADVMAHFSLLARNTAD